MSAQRIEHLDSLRGLAALLVVFGHSLQCLNGNQHGEFIYSVTSRSAVIFFFLLSGFVLSRSLEKTNALTTNGIFCYIIRRGFRLYPMTFIALLFGAGVALIVVAPPYNGYASEWLRDQIINAKTITTFSDYWSEVIMQSQYLNPPLWTIRAEIQCSIALPILILIENKKNSHQLILSILLAVFFIIDKCSHKSSFLVAFYLGHLINTHQDKLQYITKNKCKILLVMLIILWTLVARNGLMDIIILSLILALLVPTPWVTLKIFLTWLPLRFLGKISYSFYAIHMPIMFLVLMALYKSRMHLLMYKPLIYMELLIFILTVITTLPIAALTELKIERPFNKVGHLLSKKFIALSNTVLKN